MWMISRHRASSDSETAYDGIAYEPYQPNYVELINELDGGAAQDKGDYNQLDPRIWRA